ncbi:conserved hypothetical protein [Xenorhabdus bovienii str. feltiae Moldova]|uniref:Uncharacterized protein n=3 Tax=Xenorhabdus bovienii TaxID=40576 RepID=A0A077NXD2_XENBV|nr:conserved hypothetical protein [Xenorhabdus bovienii str. feltiae Moldova]
MAMDYLDYGFYQENGQTMNNITAFAFMHYNQEEKKWGIHYQRQAGAPNIREFSPPSRWSLLNRNENNIEVRVSENSFIKGTGTMSTRFPHHQPQ